MQAGCRCDIGRTRRLNEDSVVCLVFDVGIGGNGQPTGLFIVADGMGGHNAGEVASRVGATTFMEECLSNLLEQVGRSGAGGTGQNSPVLAPYVALEAAVARTNKVLFEMSRERQTLHGMGTTLVAALIIGGELYVVSIGDSRCYVINSRETIQVTRDHSQVQEMLDAGLITEEQARTHPQRNVITRVLGYYHEVTADYYQLKLYQGDNVLLCSDGLWGVLSDQMIAQTVLASSTPQEACAELVAQANQLGGPDNISVIVVRPEKVPSWFDIMTAETELVRKH